MDGILRFVAAGGALTTVLVAPNSAQLFEKPLDQLMKTLDTRAQNREIQRVLRYMKQRGLIKYQAKDYENGIVITEAGKKHLKQRSFETLQVSKPQVWDKHWRLVFFDIPEEFRERRVALTQKLRLLGFQQLQQSIWIHPFHCRGEIEAVTETLDVRKFVTYVEISQIDGNKQLQERFRQLLR